MKLHRHTETPFIKLDTGKCKACWMCVAACPNQVIGKAVFLRHRHAHIDHAAACKGCGKCVRACPQQAIRRTQARPGKSSVSAT